MILRSAVVVFLVGCAPGRDEWSDVPITTAWFTGFDLSTIAVVGGGVGGDAILEFSGREAGAIPVHLGGGTFGVAVNLAGDLEGHDGPVDIDLSDVSDPSVGDVLGTYRGTTVSGAVGVGGATRRMRNGRGASFREDQFELGLAVWGGFEWVVVREGGGGEAIVTTTSTADTGVDTGYPLSYTEPSRGCGCDGPPDVTDSADDTGATSTTPSTSTSTSTSSSTGIDPAPSVDGEDCGCDLGGERLSPGIVALLAGLAARRRRSIGTFPRRVHDS